MRVTREYCYLLKILDKLYKQFALTLSKAIYLLALTVICKERCVHTYNKRSALIYSCKILGKPCKLCIIDIEVVVTTADNSLCHLLTLLNLVLIDDIIEQHEVYTALIYRVESRTKCIAKTLNSSSIRVICRSY